MLILKTLRRKLMQKNKFTSYLLYALGEILLVVVGILIAVHFNNQNTQRRMEQAEKQALKRLVEDLKSDISRYEFLEERLAERMELCDSTLQLIYNQTTLENRLGIISIHQINFFNIELLLSSYPIKKTPSFWEEDWATSSNTLFPQIINKKAYTYSRT